MHNEGCNLEIIGASNASNASFISDPVLPVLGFSELRDSFAAYDTHRTVAYVADSSKSTRRPFWTLRTDERHGIQISAQLKE
jgi:hypothetical protein